MDDFRYALRQLRKSPGFASIAILTLALGIGANTAIFSVVKGVLLDRLPYVEPDRLVKIAEGDPHTTLPETVDFTTTQELRQRSHSFEAMALFRDGGGAVVESGHPELLEGMRVGSAYFDTLGVRIALGRNFQPEEDAPDTRYEAILSHDLWVRLYGADPSVIGRSVLMSDRSYKIVGILPENFQPVIRADRSVDPEIFTPLGYDLKQPQACRGCQHLQLVGRLRPGVSPEQARAELNGLMREIVREHPTDYDPQVSIIVAPLHDYVVGRVRAALWILLAAVAMVLLIACANVAHLALARATGRTREMALRAALGAGPFRLARQLLSESLLLAMLGGAAGVGLAWFGTKVVSGLGPKELPRAHEIHMAWPVLLFALALSLFTALLFGVVPALRSSEADPNQALKSGAGFTQSHSGHAYRNSLIALELALAFVLVTGAGLLGKSLLRLLAVNPGYDPHNVLTANVYVYGDRYKQPDAELNFYEQSMHRLRASPGIEGVAMVSTVPLTDSDRRGLHVKEKPLVNESEAPSPDTYSVSPDYFRVMRIGLKRGRLFDASDHRGASPVALISESCARAVFPNDDPIGQHIKLGGMDGAWITIVGIVGDVRQYGFDRPSAMEAYVPLAQDLNHGFSVVVRTQGDPRRFENTVRQAFLNTDDTQPLDHLRPLEDYVAESQAARRFSLMLMAVFGGLALLLAAIGVYGVVSYSVSLRTQELGIRVALGAQRHDIISIVLAHGLRLLAAGLAAGIVCSLLLTRFLSSLLFQVRPADLMTSLVVTVTLATVALLANYLPARRAARVDPMVALRCE